ncbi:MAG TPA: 23S rRNA (guanosine(2251)-2'-O)-methyltransferase RlmB [Thermoanaerobaculia bacterium]|nr:23S rRNA (guanosine(2251)-2'-O)-methyltransferase RlmB [Thermoanaerobaculia bacterium]
MILSRLHPIEEAIRSRPAEVEWVLLDSGRRDRRTGELARLCRERHVPVRFGTREALDRLARSHQGAVARMAARGYVSEDEALAGKKGSRLVIVLDGIEDPQNLGATLRVADGVGAAVVLPERGSAPLSEAASRSSAGAMERVPVARVGNLRRFLDRLKEQGFRVVGLDADGTDIYRVDLTGDLAIVLGAEGRGMRRLVREGCDTVARLPMKGALASLNVAAAAAAAAYEALRQRDFSARDGD